MIPPSDDDIPDGSDYDDILDDDRSNGKHPHPGTVPDPGWVELSEDPCAYPSASGPQPDPGEDPFVDDPPWWEPDGGPPPDLFGYRPPARNRTDPETPPGYSDPENSRTPSPSPDAGDTENAGGQLTLIFEFFPVDPTSGGKGSGGGQKHRTGRKHRKRKKAHKSPKHPEDQKNQGDGS